MHQHENEKNQSISFIRMVRFIYADVVGAFLFARLPVGAVVVVVAAVVVVKADRWPRSKAEARRRAAYGTQREADMHCPK